MNKRHILFLLLVMVAIGVAGLNRIAYASNGAASNRFAAQNRFAAELTGDQAIPAVSTWARGKAQFWLSGDGEALKFKLNAETISAVIVVQIQCGLPGINGPVVTDLYNGLAINPRGWFARGTVTTAALIPLPASPACPGGIENLGDLLDKLRQGEAYVTIRTLAHSGGEIRGQILSFDKIEYMFYN